MNELVRPALKDEPLSARPGLCSPELAEEIQSHLGTTSPVPAAHCPSVQCGRGTRHGQASGASPAWLVRVLLLGVGLEGGVDLLPKGLDLRGVGQTLGIWNG